MKTQIHILLVFFCLLNGFNTIQAQIPPPGLITAFITKWQTTTANETITIPTHPDETYNYDVDWGDGSTIEIGITGDATHTYATAGIHTVSITYNTIQEGFPRIYINNSGDRLKLLEIVQWGDNQWVSMENAFMGCQNLNIVATDTPNLDSVTSMRYMLGDCRNLIGNTAFNSWNVSTVRIFTAAFSNCLLFNQPLNNWDMSSAFDTRDMFYKATTFNQPLDNWDMSNVFYTVQMFRGADNFNQDLSSWDISNLRDARKMFYETPFSQENYDNILIGWSTLDTGEARIPLNVDFGAETNQYCLADTAWNLLVTTYNWTIIDEGKACPVSIAPKVFLQGAALNPNDGEENLMRDDLRAGGWLVTNALTSPYNDGITAEASVFNVTGSDAIVDWVWIELRDKNDNTLIIDSQSALLQRDGDVVTIDGTSTLLFNVDSGDYYIAIKHRNHIGIIAANTIALDDTTSQIDFTNPSTLTFGSNAQTTFGLPLATMGMWAGNVNGDRIIQYSGTNPDVPNILSLILNDPSNFLNFPTYVINGYNNYDVNMDGQTQYSGTNPDTPVILQNVLAHPGNFLNFSTYQIIEQLPQN